MTSESDMWNFIANETKPEMTKRIISELDDPQSFASRFISERQSEAENFDNLIDWERILIKDVLNEDKAAQEGKRRKRRMTT
jgi:hypothetical protein